jgi:hypothetical protein
MHPFRALNYLRDAREGVRIRPLSPHQEIFSEHLEGLFWVVRSQPTIKEAVLPEWQLSGQG